MDNIFGYDFSEIQAMQMNRYSRPTVDISKPSTTNELTEGDLKLISQYGTVENLENAGFYGVAGKLKRTTAL